MEEQNLENLRRNCYAPIRPGSPCITEKTNGIRPKEPSDAPPQKPLSRSCTHDLRHHAQADQGGAGLSPGPGCPCGGCGASSLYYLRDLPLGEFCPAEMGAALCAGGAPGLAGSSTPRSPPPNHVRAGAAPQSS